MDIAKFFVTLDVKGGEALDKSLKGAKSGMAEVRSTSLEMKAAMLAAFYGLEQISAASARYGTELVKYNALTDVSMKSIQGWGNAFRQVNVPMTEVMTTLKGLQSAAAKWEMGDAGMAKAISWMGSAGVGVDTGKIKDQEYMMQRVIDYIKKEKDVGRRNEVAGMFGFSDNMIQGSVRGDFSDKAKGINGVLGDNTLKTLDKINIGWDNLNDKIGKTMKGFVARHGMEFLKEVEALVPQVLHLAEALERLSKSAHIFELMGKAIEGWTIIFGGAADMIDSIAGKSDNAQKNAPSPVRQIFKDLMKGDLLWKMMEMPENSISDPKDKERAMMKVPADSSYKSQYNPNVKQENHFHIGPGQEPGPWVDHFQPHLQAATKRLSTSQVN